MKEIFKPIPNYNNYEVSNYGRVKSLERYFIRSKGGKVLIKEKILKPIKSNRGYLRVSILSKGKANCVNIHKLVAIVFLYHEPNGVKTHVRHLDGNKLNNMVDNLKIGTSRDNKHDDPIKGTSKYRGVFMSKNKWVSQICIKGKSIYLGTFDIEEDAAMSYNLKLAELNSNNQLKQKS